MTLQPGRAADAPETDTALVARARHRDEAAIRELVRRNNPRLFRTARSVLRDDAEAEEVVQETYLRAFTTLDRFRGEAAFATWLTRIALNEAYGRLRRRRAQVGLAALETRAGMGGGGIVIFPTTPREAPTPEAEAGRAEVRQVLEAAVDRLPEPYRPVFVLRDIQGLGTAETATALGIPEATVRTRLHRARRLLRDEIARALTPRFADLFPFGGRHCARMGDRVIAGLRAAWG